MGKKVRKLAGQGRLPLGLSRFLLLSQIQDGGVTTPLPNAISVFFLTSLAAIENSVFLQASTSGYFLFGMSLEFQ